jgi:hypothetical protein
VQNQYLIRIPTSKLKQLIPIIKGVFVPQVMTLALLVNIHVGGYLFVILLMDISGYDFH